MLHIFNRFYAWLYQQSPVQQYVSFLSTIPVTVVPTVHSDTLLVKRLLYVSIGWEVYVKKATSVSFYINMTWQRCQSVISTPNLVSIAKGFNMYFYCKYMYWQKTLLQESVVIKSANIYILIPCQRLKTVRGMTEDSVNTVRQWEPCVVIGLPVVV